MLPISEAQLSAMRAERLDVRPGQNAIDLQIAFGEADLEHPLRPCGGYIAFDHPLACVAAKADPLGRCLHTLGDFGENTENLAAPAQTMGFVRPGLFEHQFLVRP